MEEKNPTIVNFPLRGLDFKECMCFLVIEGSYFESIFSPDLTFADVDAPPPNVSMLYDLIANVTHESVAGTTRDKENTIWKAYIRAGSGGGDDEKWFMIQDLIVEEVRKEMIFLGETILQVFQFVPSSLTNDSDGEIIDLGTSDG